MSSLPGSSVTLKACEFHTSMPCNGASAYTPSTEPSPAAMVLNRLSLPTPMLASPRPEADAADGGRRLAAAHAVVAAAVQIGRLARVRRRARRRRR